MNRLKELRERAGIKQKDIAEMLGVTSGAISQWEKGRTKINWLYCCRLAELFNVTPEYVSGESNVVSAFGDKDTGRSSGVRVPVLGTIRAGVPVAAIEDIEDWEEISAEQAKTGEFVALRVKGNSMEPEIREGDIAIIRRQEVVESGQIAVVLVNGENATIKKVRILPAGMLLIPFNSKEYEEQFYDASQIADLPVRIYGKLVEVRRKF